MQGLIYNLLADLAERAGCQDEAWDVAIRSALGGVEDQEPGDAEDDDLPELPPLGAATGTTFRCLLRSAAPFRDEDWDDLAETETAEHGFPSVPPRADAAPEGDERDPMSSVSKGSEAAPRLPVPRPRRR